MDDLALLCQACGMCCDGSLFGRAPLAEDERAPARKTRLRVVAGGRAFEQPCAALEEIQGARDRRACAIYDARPAACRRFECVLRARHRREGGALAPRLASVRRARELIARVTDGQGRADAARAREELADLLERDFARAPAR